jgi:16S rRNA processing protein RimM
LIVAGDEAEVVAAKRAGGRPVVRLDRAVPRGTLLEVARSALPPTAEDEFYVFELVGLDVVEEEGRPLGKVTTVAAGVANDVLELDSGLSLPMVEDCVRRIDLESARILVAPGFSDPD